MAKRRRLNKRMVILLAVLGGLMVLGAVTVAIRFLMPVDPVAVARQAEQLREEDDYRQAIRTWGQAIQAADEQTKPEYHYRRAQTALEWLGEDESLNDTQRQQLYGQARGDLMEALRLDADYLEARRELCDLLWPGAVAAGRADPYISEATELLERAPDDHETAFRLGILESRKALALGEPWTTRALEHYRQAIELEPEKTEYWLGMVRFLRQANRHDQAEATIEEALERNPDDAGIRVAYAEMLQAEGENEKAREQIAQAIERDPDSAVGWMALSSYYRREEQYDQAREALEKARQADPTAPDVYIRIADAHMRQENPTAAAEVLREGVSAVEEKARELAGEETRESRQLADARWRLNMLLANVLLDITAQGGPDAQETLAEAKECLEQVEQRGRDTMQRNRIAGRIAFLEGDFDRAIRLLQSAYDQGLKGDLQLVFWLVRLYDLQQSPGASEKLIDDALARNPNHPALLRAKAEREMQFNRYESASAVIGRLLQIEPENEWALQQQALIRARLGGSITELPEDEEWSERVVRVLLDRISMLQADQKEREALAFAEELYAKRPENLQIVSALVDVLLGQGREDRAIEVLEETAERYPENEAVRQQIALLQEADPARQAEMRIAWIRKTYADQPYRLALALGQEYVRRGEVGRAGAYFEQALGERPESRVAMDRLFDLALTTQDWELAEKHLPQIRQRGYDRVGGKTYEARLHLARGEFDEAIDLLREAVEQRPTHVAAWNLLGGSFLARQAESRTEGTRNRREAREAFEEAYRLDPTSVRAMAGLAQVARDKGDTDAFEEWITRAYSLSEGREHPYIREQYLQVLEGQVTDEDRIANELIPRRERMLRDNPDDLENREALARLYEKVDRPERAEEMYQYIYRRSRNRFAAARMLAGFYARQGRGIEIDRIFSELIQSGKTPEAKAAAWVAYGQHLAGSSTEQALAAVEEAIAVAPASSAAHRTKAEILHAARRPEEAAEAMQEYIAVTDDTSVEARRTLAAMLIDAGRNDDAIEVLDDVLDSHPRDAFATSLKGLALLRNGDLDAAEGTLQRAVEMDRNYALPWQYLASLYDSRGQPDRARSALEQAWEISTDPSMGLRLAEVYANSGDSRRAERMYRRLAEDSRAGVRREAARRLIALYTGQGRWDEAARAIAEALEEFPRDAGFLLAVADVWRARGDADREVAATSRALEISPQSGQVVARHLEALLRAGRAPDVLELARRYRDRQEWGVMLQSMQAAALAAQGRTDEADERFASVLGEARGEEIDTVCRRLSETYPPQVAAEKLDTWIGQEPGDARAYLWLGSLRTQAQRERETPDYGPAIDAYRRARDAARQDEVRRDANWRLGSLYYMLATRDPQRKGEFLRRSVDAYEAVLEVSPSHIEALNNLAYIYSDEFDEPARAEPYARRAARLLDSSANILDTYGWTLARMGRYREAQTQLNEALRIEPLAVIHYHLGWTLEQQGENAEAQESYEAALASLGDDPDAADLRRKIEQGLERVR